MFVRVADAAVCFANAEGGHIVLGVDDKSAGMPALVGVPAEVSVDGLRKGVFDRTIPSITAFVSERFVNQVRLLVLSVPPGVLPHSNPAGMATRRLHTECLPFPPEQQRELMVANRHTLVRATLVGGAGNDAFVRFVNDLPGPAARDVNVLLTLSALRQHTSIGAARLGSVLQRSTAEAQDVLANMDRELDLIEATRRTARNPYPNYRLRSDVLAAMSRAVTYHRSGADDMDQKIIDHVREYGSISNRTLQRMFDIHVFAARDLITDLRIRGILTKIGDARGGTNVRYGPGDQFPG